MQCRHCGHANGACNGAITDVNLFIYYYCFPHSSVGHTRDTRAGRNGKSRTCRQLLSRQPSLLHHASCSVATCSSSQYIPHIPASSPATHPCLPSTPPFLTRHYVTRALLPPFQVPCSHAAPILRAMLRSSRALLRPSAQYGVHLLSTVATLSASKTLSGPTRRVSPGVTWSHSCSWSR